MVKVADYISNFLYEKGITDIFMLSGGGAIHLDQSVANHKGLREICVKNEATGPMMAEAYARIKNNFGVVYVTTGPGGANAVTGVVECFVDSSPVLVISGQVPRNQTTRLANIPGLRSYGIQELNIIDVVKPITKYATMVDVPENIKYELEKAIHIAKSGRPGPVWLDIPLDVQSAEIDETKLLGYNELTYHIAETTLNDKILKIVEALKTSKRPLIVAGQGIRNANCAESLKNISAYLNIPIIFSRLGLDTVPLSFETNMGIGGIKGALYNRKMMKEADVILSIGTSLSVAFAGYKLAFFNEDAKIFMVDIDPAETIKIRDRLTDVIICNAKIFLSKLYSELTLHGVEYLKSENSIWLNNCIKLKVKHREAILSHSEKVDDIYHLANWVDDISKENDIFVDDAGSIYYVAGQTLRFDSKGQREITSGAYASMGLAIPLSIGSAIANPSARILAMTGDGSLETNIQELKTLSYYNLNVKLFVINNGGYISMRDHGRHTIDERNAMLNLERVAAAYDMPYVRLEKQEDWDLLKTNIDKEGPLFIEVICNDKQKLVLPS